jgi:DNA polymerase-4
MGGVTVWVLHVDLDQFVAAVELLRRPELEGRPVVVGGDGDPTKRGVVSTASYKAREFGVRSGMPLRTAAKRCPEAIFLPVDAEAYEAASEVVMATLAENGAIVQVMGWDEAFVGARTDDPEAEARDIQRRVFEATRLYCSVGVGENKLQAKLATDYGKPAGVFRITHGTWFELFGGQPTDALWGIGSKTSKKLSAMGIETVRQLASADLPTLAKAFGPSTGPWLVQLANGISDAEVSNEPWVARSRSKETTFQQDLTEWPEVQAAVETLARQLAGGRQVIQVVVKVRYKPFFTSTHGARLASPANEETPIVEAALKALEKFTDRRPVRLVGVQTVFEP